MSFDARQPHAQPHAAVAAPTASPLTAARLRPELLAKVGETFAVALSQLQYLGATPVMRAELARLERLGVQLQEIARVLGGEGSWVTERVDLAAAASSALRAWEAQAEAAGISLSGPHEAFEAEVNAAVVEQLLNLGIEYALHVGAALVLRCGSEGNPPRPTLSFDIHCVPAPEGSGLPGDFNDLQWLLLSTLARASGYSPQRTAVGRQLLLTVALVPASEAEAGIPSAALLPKTPLAAGRRVLVVDPQDMSRVQAHRLLHEVGMHVDAASSIAQARAGLRDATHWPDVLLTGEPADAPECRAFIDTLRTAKPGLRVMEMVDDDSAFAFSVPGSDLPARVGRHTLARTLVAAVSQELDAP